MGHLKLHGSSLTFRRPVWYRPNTPPTIHNFNTAWVILVMTLLFYFIGTVSFAHAIAPSFRTVATATTGQTTSITISRPLAIVGDVMIAAITTLAPTAGLAVTAPSGWTAIRQTIQTGELAQDLFYKVVLASEPLNYTFTLNQSLESAGAIASYWQVDTNNPVDADGGQYNSGSPPTTPSITTTVSDTRLLTIFGTKTARDLNPPTNTIEHWRAAGVSGNQGFDQIFAGPGPTGTRQSTTNESSSIGQIIALRPAVSITPGSAGTVLFVTTNASNTADLEQLRKDKLESWGYSIQLIDQGAAQAVYDAAIPLADVAYIPASIASNTHRDRLANACIGVLNEEGNLADDLGFSDTVSKSNAETHISIATASHYITQPFVLGSYPLFMTGQPLYSINGIMASGASVLGYKPGEIGLVRDWASLFVIDTGGLLATGGPAPARRVHLPWGTSQVDLSEITANGDQLMKRSVDWAKSNNNCFGQLFKRAFLSNGTPLPSGETVPVGNRVKFMIYLNNTSGIQTDVSVQDVLDNLGFLYDAGTIKVDNTYTCASNPCSTTDEANIFAAIDDNTALTDAIDGDVASFTGGNTVDIGNSSQANTQIDIAANSVLALLFTVQMR